MCHQARRRNCVARVSYYVESLFACDDAVRHELLAFSRPSRGLGRLVPTTTFSLKQAWVLIGVCCSSGIHLAIYPSFPCGLVRVKIALCLHAIQHRHQGGDAATCRFEGQGKATSDLRGTCRVSFPSDLFASSLLLQPSLFLHILTTGVASALPLPSSR